MPFLLIYVTHPSQPEAARITGELLHKRLIACANYMPISSVYWWQGFPTNADEVVTIYKTRPENWEIVKSTVESMHKYEVPCIMKLPLVEANEAYEKWVYEETIGDDTLQNSQISTGNPDGFDTMFPEKNS